MCRCVCVVVAVRVCVCVCGGGGVRGGVVSGWRCGCNNI